MHPVITASVPLLEPPGWAVAQRGLFDLLDQAWRRFARDFTGPDGRLAYRDRLTSRDGVDDFYEFFFNWPQLYLLGGADDLLAESERHWHGVTRQLTELGMLKDEYERGYDWFHQGESLLLLYFLCMAAPDRWRRRALRFADLYVDPAHGNYDPKHRIITRPHNGSDAERGGLFDGAWYPWLPQEAATYGFPLSWLLPPGADEPPRDQDPRLGREMAERLGVGDTAVNLAATGLVHNALLLSGERTLPRVDRGVRRRLAGTRGGERRHPARQRRTGRHGRRVAGGPLVRRSLRLVLAARLVQRRAGRVRRRSRRCRRDR